MTTSSRPTPGLRGRLLLSVLAAIGLVLVALTAGFNLVLANRLEAEVNSVLQARASAEIAALEVNRGRIVLPDAPDERNPEAQVWVFQGARVIEGPRSAAPNDSAAGVLALQAPAARDVPSTNTRLYSLPVVQSGRRVGAVVAGVSLGPYKQTRRTALIASVVLALTVFVAVGIAASWLISRSLRPVARMTRQASEWSERDLDRRFALGPPHDELTQLAFTLDQLLDRLAASLRHEQRLSAELSHELRTPLASIAAEAQYALRHTQQSEDGRAALKHIVNSAKQMSGTLDTLIAAARAQLDPRRATSDAAACAEAASAACAGASANRGITVAIQPPLEPARVAVEQALVERILAPLIENACRHASHHVQITIDRDRTAVRFTVEDDGPGVPVEEREAIFEPGRRLHHTTTTTIAPDGAGLGLALSRRLARSAGGDVEAEHSDAGGRFVVRLPAG
jgi:signal transduction histidine kinase